METKKLIIKVMNDLNYKNEERYLITKVLMDVELIEIRRKKRSKLSKIYSFAELKFRGLLQYANPTNLSKYSHVISWIYPKSVFPCYSRESSITINDCRNNKHAINIDLNLKEKDLRWIINNNNWYNKNYILMFNDEILNSSTSLARSGVVEGSQINIISVNVSSS